MAVTEKVHTEGVDRDLLGQVDALTLSPRLAREREEFFRREVEIVADRAVLAVESWKETEGDVLDIRWARLIEKFAERTPIVIYQDQLAVANETKLFRAANPWVEMEAPNVLEMMETNKKGIRTSAARVSECTIEEWEAVREAAGFFLGKTPTDIMFERLRSLYGDWPEEMEKARGLMRQGRSHTFAPVPKWEVLLSTGLRGIIEEAQAGIEKVRSGAEPEAKKAWFWQAVVIVCEAMVQYAHRYSTLARELAEGEEDVARQKELEQIAESCRRVPEYPACTLHEAVQSRILWGIAVMWARPYIVGDDHARADQYFYPYFIKDIREKRLTIEQAADVMGTLLSNLSRRDAAKNRQLGQLAQGTLFSNVTLGGMTMDGRDANNELTYLILHMAGLLRYAEPHYTFRVNAATPQWIMLKALETNRKVGGGQPQFMSDDRIMGYLMNQGESLQDARDWLGYS